MNWFEPLHIYYNPRRYSCYIVFFPCIVRSCFKFIHCYQGSGYTGYIVGIIDFIDINLRSLGLRYSIHTTSLYYSADFEERYHSFSRKSFSWNSSGLARVALTIQWHSPVMLIAWRHTYYTVASADLLSQTLGHPES